MQLISNCFGIESRCEPVLQNLENFQNEDALLVSHFRSKPKSLKEAQAGEHAADDALKFYSERKWPKCDIIVSNPPFLGGKFLRRELGDEYVDAIFSNYSDRVEAQADLCCYWFEKARDLIEQNNCKRAGLLATQGIRGGANVQVSMIGFDDGTEKSRTLDGKSVSGVNSNLSAADADITTANQLAANINIVWSDLIEILERGETGEIYDFKTGNYGIVDVGPKGLDPILKQLEAQVNEQILERLLALNQQRAAEEKSAPSKSRRTSRAKTAEEFV